MSKVLIDGDVLIYECAFAGQQTAYWYEGERFRRAIDAQDHVEAKGLNYRQLRKDGVIESTTEYLDASVCEKSFKKKLGDILTQCNCDDYLIIVSGDSNFRDEMETTRPYKEKRPPKPYHYQFMRSCVLSDNNSELTLGIEADDLFGIMMTDDPNHIIATVDKDLNMIPGRHYDWNKGIKYKTNPAQSLYWFHTQLLTGDSVDSIPGIPGLGEKKAIKLLEGSMDDPRAGWETVLSEYLKGPFEFKDKSKTPDDNMAYLTEQGQLLWMMRHPEERWNPQHHEEYYV